MLRQVASITRMAFKPSGYAIMNPQSFISTPFSTKTKSKSSGNKGTSKKSHTIAKDKPTTTSSNASAASKSTAEQVEFALPPGFDVSKLNSMSQEELVKLFDIDVSKLPNNNLNFNMHDQMSVLGVNSEPAVYDEDEDSTPSDNSMSSLKRTPSSSDVVSERRSVNKIPSSKVRDADYKGRVTIIKRLKTRYIDADIGKNLRKVTRGVLSALDLGHFDVAVTLVMGKGMQDLNRAYRQVDEPTDVLSFSMEPPHAEGRPVEFGEMADLGEVVVCLPYLQAQAALRLQQLHTSLPAQQVSLSGAELDQLPLDASVFEVHAGQSPPAEFVSQVTPAMVEDELYVVLVHGILHLCGYDHHTTEMRDRMQAATDLVMGGLVSRGLVPQRTFDMSQMYVLQDALPEQQVVEEFGANFRQSGTGEVADSFEEGVEGEEVIMSVDALNQEIMRNPDLQASLVEAGFDIMGADGCVCIDKVRAIDWNNADEDGEDDLGSVTGTH